MTDDELIAKMLAFVETQDRDCCDEWYATPRDFAAVILSDFAKHIGLELVVPEHIPRKDKPTIDREAMLKALLPGIEELFNIKYKELQERGA